MPQYNEIIVFQLNHSLEGSSPIDEIMLRAVSAKPSGTSTLTPPTDTPMNPLSRRGVFWLVCRLNAGGPPTSRQPPDQARYTPRPLNLCYPRRILPEELSESVESKQSPPHLCLPVPQSGLPSLPGRLTVARLKTSYPG